MRGTDYLLTGDPGKITLTAGVVQGPDVKCKGVVFTAPAAGFEWSKTAAFGSGDGYPVGADTESQVLPCRNLNEFYFRGTDTQIVSYYPIVTY